jgi:hypothetical protein
VVISTLQLLARHNYTGYAQVLEDWSPSGSNPDVTYTIGDDVVTQYDSTNGARHLLYDGHSSVRHLADTTGSIIANQSYNYDAYGNALGFNPADADGTLDEDDNDVNVGGVAKEDMAKVNLTFDGFTGLTTGKVVIRRRNYLRPWRHEYKRTEDRFQRCGERKL